MADTTGIPPNAKPANVEEAISAGFMLGWTIAELHGRVKIAVSDDVGSGLRLASVWRAAFNRIAALHTKAFPKSSTALTLYEPPSRDQLPYLYPPAPDYAD